MKKMISFYIILLLITAVFFQNCSDSGFLTSNDSSPVLTSSVSGNGTGYDGKLNGIYYNYIPKFKCNENESFSAEMTIDDNKVNYIRNSSLQCQKENTNLNHAELDFSPFHNTLVGYKENIFELSSEPFTSIPDRLVEVWCFNQGPNKNFEIIQQYQNNAQTSNAQIYYYENEQVKKISSVASNRLIENFSALFKGQDYNLKIDRQTMTEPGLYLGKLEITIDGKPQSKLLNCRFGGYLNANLWPSKVVYDESTVQEVYNHDETKIYAVTTLVNDKNLRRYKIYEKDLTTDKPASVLPNLIISGYGSDAIKMSPDGQYIVYRNHGRQLFSHHIPTKKTRSISKLVSGAISQYIFPEFEIIGNYVYYRQLLYLNGSSSLNNLFKVKLDGSNEVNFFKNTFLENTVNLDDSLLFTLKQPNVIYNLGNSLLNYISQIFSLEQMTISSDTLVNSFARSKLVGNKDQFLIFNLEIVDPTTLVSHSEVYVRPLDIDKKAFPLGIKGRISTVLSSSSNFVYLKLFSSSVNSNAIIINTSNWNYIEVPKFHSFNFTPLGDSLIGFNGDSLFNINLNLGTTAQICRELGPIQNYYVANSGTVYLIKTESSITSVYRYLNTGTCKKLNEVPIAGNSNPNLIISNDERQAMVVVTSAKHYLTGFENLIYWMPLNGQAPIKISTPGADVFFSSRYRFSKDSKSIFYFGFPLVTKESQLFNWKIPNTDTR